MMPFKDGFTLAEEIRSIDENIPIIFLTAKSLKDDIIKGFKLGADDYLTKPFDSEILLLKIKSIFKRKFIENAKVISKEQYNFSSFVYNSKFRTLKFKEEQEINLSPKESKLLQLLLQNTNDLTSREEALVKIWNDDNYFTSRSMDVYVTKIRKYLKKDPSVSIENIHGKGFKLKV
jgi:two-component system OmpR family response regulator